ncbi:MAG: SWIM zinc finger family protein [Myxococcota bacterium]
MKREPTFFRGELARSLEFREAISALNAVVVSDLRWKPKDKTAYKEWAQRQEIVDMAGVAAQRSTVATKINALREELNTLYQQRSTRMNAFWSAQQRYFDYLYTRDYDAWYVLDPVITVHPDEIFFECFSQDESSYGRLGCSYEVFQEIGEFSCGTTNIDYSRALYDEFQKIRTYKTTRLEVDPTGFEVQTGRDDSYREVKIDLPDTWVRGFLQVNSAMALPAVSFQLHPMDVANCCFVLRRHREIKGPRAMRYHLKPGEPVRVLFEPWGIEVPCPRSIYTGDKAHEIRVWGRRRLHILERLLPVARSVTVHLLGQGLPSFYIADLGHMSFTLGLSGWTANDWATAGNFDLLAPRAEVDSYTRQQVFDALKERWFDTVDGLSGRLGLDRATVLGALGAWTQAGRAIFDLNKGVYRVRELSRDPLPLSALRWSNPREEQAARFVKQRGAVRVTRTYRDPNGNLHLTGQVRDGSKTWTPSLTIDADQRVTSAECGCSWYVRNRLYKGPCEHMLALRLMHAQQQS